MQWLEQAAQLCLVLGFCGGVFNYIVIRPLNDSIRALGEVVNDLRNDLKYDSERLHKLAAKVNSLTETVGRLEKSADSAHERIDKFLQEGGEFHDVGH